MFTKIPASTFKYNASLEYQALNAGFIHTHTSHSSIEYRSNGVSKMGCHYAIEVRKDNIVLTRKWMGVDMSTRFTYPNTEEGAWECVWEATYEDGPHTWRY